MLWEPVYLRKRRCVRERELRVMCVRLCVHIGLQVQAQEVYAEVALVPERERSSKGHGDRSIPIPPVGCRFGTCFGV